MNDEKRFEFGKNWKQFLETLTEEKIDQSRTSLINLLKVKSLKNKTFIDIGSGSGLSSLSAYNLGATVTSFDYDDFSVEATKYTKEKFSNKEQTWIVGQGDILDDKYIENLGKYDVVYSWGVLHHTGSMYKALDNASKCVSKDGTLVVAIYNTQLLTPIWKKIKLLYVSSPFIIKKIMSYFYTLYFMSGLFFVDIFRLRNPLARYKELGRGMSFYTDVVDWIGGYPFETATPEEIFHFYQKRGFILENLKTVGGKLGCNEFVFKRVE